MSSTREPSRTWPSGSLYRQLDTFGAFSLERQILHLPPPSKKPASDRSDLLDAMRPLETSLGKEQVRRIVDLLGSRTVWHAGQLSWNQAFCVSVEGIEIRRVLGHGNRSWPTR